MEEEVSCLSSGSDKEESELRDAIPKCKEVVLEELRTLVRRDGSPRSTASRENAVERMDAALELLVVELKRIGYRQAESLLNKHIDDLEELLDKEERKWKALQEERTRMGNKVRGIVREELKEVLGKYERQRETERVKEWKFRETELGEEMKRVLEEWGEKRGEKNRDEMRKEMDKALGKRDDRIREEMGK